MGFRSLWDKNTDNFAEDIFMNVCSHVSHFHCAVCLLLVVVGVLENGNYLFVRCPLYLRRKASFALRLCMASTFIKSPV